jgi:hypothetical protein
MRVLLYFRCDSGGRGNIEMSGAADRGREPAYEELLRAEAEIARALAKGVKWLLCCIVALTGAAVLAVALGHFLLGMGCLMGVGALAAVLRGTKGPSALGRSSVM